MHWIFVTTFLCCACRYQLTRVNPKSLGENCKWLDMFEDTDVALFSVALTDYDEYIVDSNGVAINKILAAKHLFESIITHRVFSNKKFLLLLTKFDLLEEKIEQVPLTQCEWFCDFDSVNIKRLVLINIAIILHYEKYNYHRS